MIRRQLAFLWGNLTLRKHHLLMLAILSFAFQTQAKFCTSLKAVKNNVDAYGQTLCTQSYQERCGWFTFKMCTFYEEIPCGKNETKITYKVITECCKGYKLDDNNLTCIHEEETTKGDPNTPHPTDKDDEDEDDGFSISHGAFAAIASAGLFIICITIVIIIHVRKKQLKEEKKQKEAGTPMETRKMIHV